MDLVKIGKYIAGKRKALGLTQAQVAEKLGMSDKSVSKWERGICLPDVSVYMELCEILGISLNEFIAGEDLPQENIIKQSEKNLIRVTEDGNIKRKKLRKIIAVLLCLTLLVSTALCSVIFMRGDACNYVEPLAKDSAEMEMAQFLSGTDGAFLYRYRLDDTFTEITVTLSTYQKGVLQKTEELGRMGMLPEKSWEGMAAFIPDFEHFKIRVILTGDGTKYETEFDILKNISDREYLGRSAVEIEDRMKVSPDDTEKIAAFIYSRNGLRTGAIGDVTEGADWMKENDYMYLLSIQFGRTSNGK